MSGIAKGLKKVFRKAKDISSKVGKALGLDKLAKVAKKVWESKIGRMVVIAAAVWFTAGTAAAYFAAPQAGLGAAMSSSASSMWTTASTFLTGAPAAAAPTTAANAAGAAATAATPGASVAAGSTVAGAANTAAATALPQAATQGIIGKTLAYAGKNPIVPLILGQGLSAASQGKAQRQAVKDNQQFITQQAAYGQNYTGEGGDLNTGATGILSPFMTPIAAPAAPTVSGQAQTRVPAAELAKLNRNGLIANRSA